MPAILPIFFHALPSPTVPDITNELQPETELGGAESPGPLIKSSKITLALLSTLIESISGNEIDLSKYKDKAILVVNTASYCGFTKQYTDLQNLWDKYKSKGLIVLGVPSNSFNQEKKSDQDVKEFCEINFNINFPLTSITDVKGNNAIIKM